MNAPTTRHASSVIVLGLVGLLAIGCTAPASGASGEPSTPVTSAAPDASAAPSTSGGVTYPAGGDEYSVDDYGKPAP